MQALISLIIRVCSVFIGLEVFIVFTLLTNGSHMFFSLFFPVMCLISIVYFVMGGIYTNRLSGGFVNGVFVVWLIENVCLLSYYSYLLASHAYAGQSYETILYANLLASAITIGVVLISVVVHRIWIPQV